MYKPLADSTLIRMPKKEIIELLRTAEHNAKVSQEYVAQQAENLKDWEPVVRCKDCKHLVAVNVNGKGIPTCRGSGMEVAPDEFCSRGDKGRR